MGQIGPGALVYLDTNVLIYLTEGVAEQKVAVSTLIQGYEAAGAKFITSDLAFTELLVHPIRTGNTGLLLAYERLLSRFVEAMPISREVVYLAAKLRAAAPAQRTPDAIHVATAMLAGAVVFVTGDKGIRNLPESISLVLV